MWGKKGLWEVWMAPRTKVPYRSPLHLGCWKSSLRFYNWNVICEFDPSFTKTEATMKYGSAQIFVQTSLAQTQQNSCWSRVASLELLHESQASGKAKWNFAGFPERVESSGCVHAAGPAQSQHWNASHLWLGETPGNWNYCCLSWPSKPANKLSQLLRGHEENPDKSQWIFPWLPEGLQVTWGWSLAGEEEEEGKAQKSSLATSWYFSICFFSLLNFL